MPDLEKIDCKMMSKYGKVLECEDERVILEVAKDKIAEVSSELLKNLPVEDLNISEIDIEEIISDIFNENTKIRKKSAAK